MRNPLYKHPIIPFSLRFIALHVLTYLVFGIFFMLVSRYFEYFKSELMFKLVMKSPDALSIQLAPLIQIFRGALLALAIFPFREVIIGRNTGWIKLFVLLFVLTSIGAVITGPGSIEGFIYTRFPLNFSIGYPEVTLQIFTFSWLFCRWQGRKTATCKTKKIN